MDINWIELTFSLMTFILLITGLLIYYCEDYLPNWLRQSFCYGKFAEKVQVPLISKIEVPKRWFKHFYIFSAPFSTYILYLTWCKYFYDVAIPEFILSTLDLALGSNRKLAVPAANTLLAITLMTVQCMKRYYETQFVSIFSDAKLNILPYIAGFIHYTGVIFVIVGESEGFFRYSVVKYQSSLSLADWIAAFIFLWMSYEQLKTNFILANLRKNRKGVIVTRAYKIPSGRLFEFTSNPLQFTEIMMYGMLLVILRDSSYYITLYQWVFVNQFLCALLSHRWYKKTFEDYPCDRTIIIPLLL